MRFHLDEAVQQAFGWGIAFSLLAAGPVVGIGQMLRLKRYRIGTAAEK